MDMWGIMKKLRWQLVLYILLICASVVCANTFVVTTLTNPKVITVVEAQQNYDATGNGPSDPMAQDLNTVPYDGIDRQIAFDGDVAWISNDMWGGRSGWTADGLLVDGLWHADRNNGHGNNAPTITTQIDVPLGSYEVFVVYCSADPEDLSTHHGGMVKARLHDPTNTSAYNTYGSEGNTLGLTEGEGTGIDVVSGWSMVVASLGIITNTGSLAIDIANDTRRIGDASRNLYIGLGYRLLSCDNQAPLIQLDDDVFVEMNTPVLLDPIVTDDGKPYLEGCDPVDPLQGTSVGLSYQWSVVDPAQSDNVIFTPDANRREPNIVFTQCGDFDLKLQVWDDKDGLSPDTGTEGGKTSTDTVTFHVACPPDCNTLQAVGLNLQADISGPFGAPDCYVDIYDLQVIALEWLGVPSIADIYGADSNPDSQVNIYDMLLLGQQWLDCIDPQNANCSDPYELLRVTSPNGKVAVQFHIMNNEGVQNALYWSVAYKGEIVMDKSQLSYTLQDAVPLVSGFKLVDFRQTTHDSSWTPVYGERSNIRNHYNQLLVTVEDDQNPPRRIQLTFRAYDEGAAFQAAFPEQEALSQITINQENTQFSFTDDHWAWAVYSAQGVYSKKRLSQIGSNCERPLTMKVREDLYLSVQEAGLVDYARMRLKEHTSLPNTLVSQLGSSATVNTPYEFPWRVLMIAEEPGKLMEQNYLVLNLNKPCEIADTSWIAPGKVMRDMKMTTPASKAIVDFAAAAGIDYVHIDAGWYGHEGSSSSDPLTVTPVRSEDPSNFDLHEIISYAHAHGVKVMVYVNHIHLETQLDDILDTYQTWGIDGIKYGFVNVGSQYWTDWLHDAVRKAADYGFVVDVHDEYRPTGYERTYPNFMTAEGIRGNETGPTAALNLINPFTRFVCGAGDYTICWHSGVDSGQLKCSWPHQMAASVVYYSPLQFMFWYDSADQFSGTEPYLDYFKHMKTVWDETKVIQGEIGEYITVARRTGQDWFVGTMNAVERRQLDIPLSFLTPGETYIAYVYKDTDPAATTIKQVSYDQLTVTSDSVIPADMAGNGGHAMRIVLDNPTE